MKILFVLMTTAFLFLKCPTHAPVQQKPFEVDVKYASSTLGSKMWNKPFYTNLKKFYTQMNSDTFYESYYDSTNRNLVETTKYIKVRADELKLFNEPAELHGFSFIGVYTDPVNIPGFYVVVYGKAGKGVFRKFCYAPGAVFYYDYSSIDSTTNPFKNDSLPQSDNYRVEMHKTDTIRF